MQPPDIFKDELVGVMAERFILTHKREKKKQIK